MDSKDKSKFKLKIQFDRVLDAFLYSKRWRKQWERGYTNLRYYYLTAMGVKFFEKVFKYKFEDFNLYALGQSHLDACWKWTKLSTIRRTILTFDRAVKNIEKYPFFIFSQTSPQYYDWIKRLRPDLFKKVQELVNKGRFEICGGCWIEPDCNLPSGESLVRQRFYGQMFFLENFGKISEVASLEDTFGFSANLPQIFVKSGAKYFWTTKITWNRYTEFPFANFYWQGIDNTSIFTHCFVFNLPILWHLPRYKRLARRTSESGLVFNSTMKMDDIKSNLQDDYVQTCGIFYGFGDGGMGPFEEEICLYSEFGRLGLLKFTTFENFFKILKKDCGDLIPIWNDEFYLELHRGCYTTQSYTKKLNRFSEINLRNSEILNTFFTLLSEGFEYPREKLESLWKDLLFNQFHDILPGSSIQDVYYEQEKELERIITETKKSIKKILEKIASAVKIEDSEKINDAYVVFNTLNWTRSGFVSIEENKEIKELYIKNVPSLGFKQINLSDLRVKEEENSNGLSLEESEEKIVLENQELILTINRKTGKIISLKSKKFEKEFIRGKDGIGLHIYRDKPKEFPAWDIDRRYTINSLKLGGVKGIRIIEDKENRSITVKFIYIYKKSKISQYIILRDQADFVEFRSEVDIRDKNLNIKLRIPFNLDTNHLYSEIPYGVLKRKIVPETEMEEGKWEFSSQKWITISDQKHGFTLVNDCKYGFNSNKKGLYISLLRTPHYPTDPFFSYIKLVPKKQRVKHTDLGKHVIRYGLKIYQGDWLQSEPWKFGYEFNYPLLITKIRRKTETSYRENESLTPESKKIINNLLRRERGLIQVSRPNVILQTIKPHEHIPMGKLGKKITSSEIREGLILRLYETAGLETECNIKCHEYGKIKKVIETDLLEMNQLNSKKIDIKGNQEFKLKFSPFEIKTLKIQMT